MIVNTVVIVRALFGRPDSDVAIALGCFGGGSMAAALLLPRILDRLPDRRVMLPAAIFLAFVQLALAALFLGTAWFSARDLHHRRGRSGVAGAADRLGPARGRLLRNHDADRPASAALGAPADRPAVFAAQFALSHACWLLTYPLAGWLGLSAGMPLTLAALGLLTLLGAAVAAAVWPADDPEVVAHLHAELDPDHPHLRDHHGEGFATPMPSSSTNCTDAGPQRRPYKADDCSGGGNARFRQWRLVIAGMLLLFQLHGYNPYGVPG